MKEISVHVGKRIRLYRKMKNMTIEVFAGLINKSKATVSKYENGDIAIDIETLFIIANALDISVNQLIDYDKEVEETETRVDLSGRRHGKPGCIFISMTAAAAVSSAMSSTFGELEKTACSAPICMRMWTIIPTVINVSISITAPCAAMIPSAISSLKTRIIRWNGYFSTPSILSAPQGA